MLFYAFATWGNAGFLREQVCKYMCPYARFQSAMFDRNTLIIAYDPTRGEPRGPRKRGLASVLERARGLLDPNTAYDYVFRASKHPSAATQAAHAKGTITWDGDLREVEPCLFGYEELGDCIDCGIGAGLPDRHRHPQRLQYECIACGVASTPATRSWTRWATRRAHPLLDQNAIDGKPTRTAAADPVRAAGRLHGNLGSGRGYPLGPDREALRDATLYRETADGWSRTPTP